LIYSSANPGTTKKECVYALANISKYSHFSIEGSPAIEVYKVTGFCCEKRGRWKKNEILNGIFKFGPTKLEE